MTQLLDLIGNGVIVHTLLIGSAFDGWHGLFVSPPLLRPDARLAALSLTWIAACLAASWRICAGGISSAGSAGAAELDAPIRVVAVTIAVIAVLALGCSAGPDRRHRLTGSQRDRAPASTTSRSSSRR